MKTMTLDFDKFKDLVHYVCDKASANPACLGSIKLNKVLWYSDAVHYLRTGKSITGETYVKRQFGPVPKHILRAVDALVADDKIARGKAHHFGHIKMEYISIDDPDISAFSSDEISLVDNAFEHVCLHHTAKSVSAETHDVIWQLAKLGEEIPLYTVFASSVGEVDEEDVAWATEKLRDLAVA